MSGASGEDLDSQALTTLRCGASLKSYIFMQKKNISGLLRTWYREHKRDLPWRYTTDPYHIWVSEIILQQTRIKQGIPYYTRFIEAFPDIHKLASASPTDVLKAWQGLGYYTRARNLHETARLISGHLGGQFPG